MSSLGNERRARSTTSRALLSPVPSNEVVMTVSSFAAALTVVAASDLVATVPSSLHAVLGPPLGLTAVAGRVPSHAIEMALCWHERTHADPAAVFFHALVRRAMAHQDR